MYPDILSEMLLKTAILALILVSFNISNTQTKKSDRRSSTTVFSTPAESVSTTPTQSRTMVPDKEVSVKSKVKEDKEWPIREMIAILGKLALTCFDWYFVNLLRAQRSRLSSLIQNCIIFLLF